jgi:hypothetical protein
MYSSHILRQHRLDGSLIVREGQNLYSFVCVFQSLVTETVVCARTVTLSQDANRKCEDFTFEFFLLNFASCRSAQPVGSSLNGKTIRSGLFALSGASSSILIAGPQKNIACRDTRSIREEFRQQ